MQAVALPDELVRTVSLLLEDLGTPIALSMLIRLRHGDWDGISEFHLNPRDYHEAEKFAADSAAVGFLKKLKELPTSHDRAGRAKETWWAAERKCFRSNERLAPYLPENRLFSADREELVSDFLSDVKRIIVQWIGHEPPDLLVGRFGPGATFSDRGGRTTVPDKMTADPVMTRDAVWFLPQWLGTQWGAFHAQRHGEITYVPGNRFTTVPKTSKTDRAIASEPSLNVFYQLALGRCLRARLRNRAGWDLNTAQEVHQQVAEASSVSREFATLDLSNASDTVCKTLVRILMPPSWFSQLDDLRSKKTLIDGKWVVLEKFSSMGNGFTFELETLLFAAIACAVSRKAGYAGELGRDVFVFGDDIIVKTDAARPLKSVLESLGFDLNAEKSYFGDEPFRESCGADFFSGKPVRPYYLKELPNGPQGLIAFANGVRALTQRLALAGVTLRVRAWLSILDAIPTRVRILRGPSGLGDIVIHDDEKRWLTKNECSIRYIRAYVVGRRRVVHFDNFKPEIVLACATYGTGITQGGVIPRDGVLTYKSDWVPWS